MQKISCSYNHECLVYGEKIDNISILVLDFNIKEYKLFNPGSGSGWKTYKFPKNIIINDKLYLTEERIEKIVVLLDGFIQTGMIESDETTDRGFSIANLMDFKNNIISIQNSSAATDDYIWFGTGITKNNIFSEKNGEINPYVFEKGDVLIEDRLHLNKQQALELKQSIIYELKYFNLDSEIKVKNDKKSKNKI